MVSARGEPIKWLVTRVEKGSVRFKLEAVPNHEDISPEKMPEAVVAVVHGLHSLQREAVRPDYFSDRALDKAKELASLAKDDFTVRVLNGSLTVKPTVQLVANVERISQAVPSSIGSVDGYLHRVDLHGKRQFAIFDRVTEQRIECHFGERIPVAEIGQALEKRVRVHGEVRYKGNGDVVSVLAESIETFPPSAKLPSVDDIAGILAE